MAMFFAQRVTIGKSAFSDLPNGSTNIVPNALEAQAAGILLDSGLPELVPVRLGGTGVTD
jgi:dsRNA-specific ribonuclease